MVVGVDDCAAAVDALSTIEVLTRGTPVGVELGSATAVGFCANKDAVGVGTLSMTEPEAGR